MPQDRFDAALVAAICRDFEAAWAVGEPTIRDYLTRIDAGRVKLLVKELLLIDLRYRRKKAPDVGSDFYAEQLEEFKREVDEVFQLVDSTFDPDETNDYAPGESTKFVPDEQDIQVRLLMDRYKLDKRLGQGAFGSVYKAYDPNLDRWVAIKIPRQDRDHFDSRRFLAEAQAAAALRHPNIVPVFEAGSFVTTSYITFAFVEGQSLRHELLRGNLTLRQKVELLETIARALAYAHAKHVVHCDIKPDNIALEDGEAHVLDFGLARIASTSSNSMDAQDAGAYGTLGYMSPEQASGQTDVGPATDQYSLGCMLYEFMAGKRVFQDSSDKTEYIRRHRSEKIWVPAQSRQENEELAAVCERATQRLPEDRYPSCETFADDLRRWLDDFPVRTLKPDRVKEAEYWCKRNPLPTRLILSLVMAAIITLGLYAFAVQQRNDAELARKQSDRDRVAAQQSLAESTFQLARFQGSQGKWIKAIDTVDQALTIETPESWEMRFFRLQAIHAGVESNVRIEQFVTQVEEDLSRVPIEYHGRLRLWRAELTLFQDVDKSLSIFQEAIDLGVPAADELYAKAMLAENSLDCLSLLDHASQLEPFDRRYARMKLLLLMSLGKWERSLTECERFDVIFPDDPMPSVVRSTHAALHGDQERALTLATHDTRFPEMRELSVLIAEKFSPLAKKLADGEDFTNFEAFSALLPLVMRLSQSEGKTIDSQFAGPPCIVRAYRNFIPPSVRKLRLDNPIAMARAVYALAMGDDALLDGISNLSKLHPEGVIATFGIGRLINAELGPNRESLEKIVAACDDGLELDFLIPNSARLLHNFRAQSLYLLYHLEKKVSTEPLKRALPSAKALLDLEPSHYDAAVMVPILEILEEHQLLRDIAAKMLSKYPDSAFWLLNHAKASVYVEDYWSAVRNARRVREVAKKDEKELVAEAEQILAQAETSFAELLEKPVD
ncbi:MAG: serine/threonine-protein kinase [Pirellulaceae bacterium]